MSTIVIFNKELFDEEMRGLWRKADAVEAAFVTYVDYLDVVHGEPEDVYDIAEADPFYKYLMEQELLIERKMLEVNRKYGVAEFVVDEKENGFTILKVAGA